MNHHSPPRKARKLDQVLTGARAVFMRDGFDGASVDEIAKEAGVSKATLYSYFADKRLLFLEVARAECDRQADRATAEIDMAAPVAEVLAHAARHMIEFFLSDFAQQTFRICVAEADRFPELGLEFYETGPAEARRRLTEGFAQAVAEGRLAIDDLDLAADQFAELCKADIFARSIFGVQRSYSQPEVDRIVQGAVQMFLARYGVEGA